MNNHNTTATSLPNAANKVIVNMTGSSSPAQINMISSSLQKPVFQAAPTTTKPTNPTLIPINITVPASTPITLVPTNQVTSTSGINSPSSSYGGFGEYTLHSCHLRRLLDLYIFNELKPIVAIVVTMA